MSCISHNLADELLQVPEPGQRLERCRLPTAVESVVLLWLGIERPAYQIYIIGNWCDSLHVTAFHLRFSPQVLGYHLECSQISKFPLPAAKLFWSSPVPFWVPDMSCVGTSHDNFGAPHKWIGVTCPKHCYLRGFRHLTPFHSKTWIALVASCGDPWSQFLWVALFRIRDLGRPWEPQNISLNIATKIQIHVMAMIDFQGISLQKPRPTEAENG